MLRSFFQKENIHNSAKRSTFPIPKTDKIPEISDSTTLARNCMDASTNLFRSRIIGGSLFLPILAASVRLEMILLDKINHFDHGWMAYSLVTICNGTALGYGWKVIDEHFTKDLDRQVAHFDQVHNGDNDVLPKVLSQQIIELSLLESPIL